jgi:hypothetical protein
VASNARGDCTLAFGSLSGDETMFAARPELELLLLLLLLLLLFFFMLIERLALLLKLLGAALHGGIFTTVVRKAPIAAESSSWTS